MDNFMTSVVAPSGRPDGTESPQIPIGAFANGLRRASSLGAAAWAIIASVVVTMAVAVGGEISSNFLYGIDDASVLYKIDPVALTSGTVGPTSLSTLANALALDNRGNLFAVDGNNNLWCINDANLQGVQILASGSLGLPADPLLQPRSAAFYDNAYWFFVGDGTTGTTDLRKLTLDYSGATPQVSGFASYEAVGVGTPNAFGDIAITPEGKLYAYTSGSTARFYSLDLATIGSGTTVSGYTELKEPGQALSGVQIAFLPNGTLYGNDWNTGTWYTVDTSSGNLDPILTQSGTFQTIATDNKSFRDLGGTSIQAVPEPSTLMLVAMGGGVLTWRVSRRRKRRNGAADAVADSPDGQPQGWREYLS